MARHYGMSVETVAGILCDREVMTECLKAGHARVGDDHRNPATIEDFSGDVGGASDGANLGRGIERRADFVVRYRCTDRAYGAKDVRQVPEHPLRALRPRDAGKPNHPIGGKGGQSLGCRDGKEKNRIEAGELGRFHHRRGASEIVAIVGDQRTGWQRARRRHDAPSRASLSSGLLPA